MTRRRRPLVAAVTMVVAAAAGTAAADTASAGAEPSRADDPPWSVDESLLAAALDCPDTFEHPEREPVLLVHGTFTGGREQYGWNLLLLLPERGFDVCVVTYPDRGLGDLQVSAEYVAHAVQTIHGLTGRKVDVMGHSQGGLLPRWAIKFWPSVRAVVDDAVLVAPPSHGTDIAAGGPPPGAGMPAAFFQMGPDSQFIAALNAGEEAPAGPSWTVLYTEHDELVQPVRPVPTAALDWGLERPDVRNILIQDVCPGRFVDHLTIGTTDRLSQELMIDAFTDPGPADPARLGPLEVTCALPDQYVVPDQLAALLDQMVDSFGGGMPAMDMVQEEPELKAYAAALLATGEDDDAAPAPDGPAPTGDHGAVTPVGSSAGSPTLPATGGGAAPVAALLAAAAGMALAATARRR